VIDFNEVRTICARREIDLVIKPPPPSYSLCLHGELDGYGDFFSVIAKDVEYLEVPGGITVVDVVYVNQIEELAALSPKWSSLRGQYSGPALAFRSADAEHWGTGVHDFVIVGGTIECHPGRDWAGLIEKTNRGQHR
jgi:hypothetical protein